MTLKTYLASQKKQKKNMSLMLTLIGTYFTIVFLKSSLLLIAVLICVYMLPILVIASTVKESILKKEKKLEGMRGSLDEQILFFQNKKNRMHRQPKAEWIVIPYCCLFMILIFEFVPKTSKAIFYVVIVLMISIIFYAFLKRLNRNPLIFFHSGMLINQRLYSRSEIRKHQWIKLRNQDQLLELQMKDYYTSFVIAEKDVEQIEKLLL
ncbi:MAG: hypothetical protein JXR88_10355 [Clostridia bacterium]|nr:hypothetical protein [Clostridia bacterium]